MSYIATIMLDEHFLDMDEDMLWNDVPDYRYAYVVAWPMTTARLAGNINPIFASMNENWHCEREIFLTDIGNVVYPIIYCNVELSHIAMYERLLTGKSLTHDAIQYSSESPFYQD